jgi:hypothetical protein
MQLARSYHGTKQWADATGELTKPDKYTGAPMVVDKFKADGRQFFAHFTRELESVTAEVANFIELNPRSWYLALQKARSPVTNSMEPVEQGRHLYEMREATRLRMLAENYVVVNHVTKMEWMETLLKRFPKIKEEVRILAICWTVTMEAAADILNRYQQAQWKLAQSLGQVIRSDNGEETFMKDYVQSVCPEGASLEQPGL